MDGLTQIHGFPLYELSHPATGTGAVLALHCTPPDSGILQKDSRENVPRQKNLGNGSSRFLLFPNVHDLIPGVRHVLGIC